MTAVKPLDAKTTKEFVLEWTGLEARGRAVDFERASLITKWSKRLGSDVIQGLLKEDVGLGPPRLNKIASQVAALAVIPSRKTWEAIGWGWVSKLSGVECEVERARIEHTLIVRANMKGGVLQDGAIKDELKRIGAEALLPKERGAKNDEPDIFRLELLRLVRSEVVALDKVDPYVAKVGRFAELLNQD